MLSSPLGLALTERAAFSRLHNPQIARLQLCERFSDEDADATSPQLPHKLRRLATYLRNAASDRDRSARLIKLGDSMPLAPM